MVLALAPKLLNYENYIEGTLLSLFLAFYPLRYSPTSTYHFSVWNLREQLAIAALDQGEIDLAKEQIASLTKQFPDSVRVGRIQGMLHEAQGQFTEAMKLYEELLKKDLANIAIMKRKVKRFYRRIATFSSIGI